MMLNRIVHLKNTRRVRFNLTFYFLFLILLLPFSSLQADPGFWILQAQKRLQLGDRRGALEAFQKASWEMPQDANIHYNMGVLSESIDRDEEAVSHYSSYLRWQPGAEDRGIVKNKIFILCGRLGAEAYKNTRYHEAVEWYYKAKELYPNAKAVYYNLSRVYQVMGNHQKVVESLNEYLRHCSAEEKASVKKQIITLLYKDADRFFREGNYKRALTAFVEVSRWDPKDTRFILYQAQCKDKLGLLRGAEKKYFEYLRLEPASPRREWVENRLYHIYIRQATQYLKRGRLASVEKQLNNAFKINSNDLALHQLYADLYLRQNKPEKSIAHLEKVLQMAPQGRQRYGYIQKMREVCLSMVNQALRENHHRTALSYLKKADAWDPENPIIIHNLAKVYEANHNWEMAVQSLKKYLTLKPNAINRDQITARVAYYYYILGADHYRRGTYKEAQNAFEQALLIRPDDPALLYNLAMVLLKRGRTNESLHFMERYCKHEKDPGEVRQVRQQMQMLAKRAGGSYTSSQKRLVATSLGYGKRTDSKPADRGVSSVNYREKAFLLSQSGQWKEALAYYEKHISLFPSERSDGNIQREISSVYRELGRTALMENNPTKALEALDMAKQWAPTDAVSYLWKGGVYESKGKPQKALGVYQGSLRFVKGGDGREAIMNKIKGLLTHRLQDALLNEDYSYALNAINTLESYLGPDRRKDFYYQKARLEKAVGNRSQAFIQYGLHLLTLPRSFEEPRIHEELRTLLVTQQEATAILNRAAMAYQRGISAAAKGDYPFALFCLMVTRCQKTDKETFPNLDKQILHTLDILNLRQEAVEFIALCRAENNSFALTEGQKDYLLKDSERIILDYYNKGLYEKGMDRLNKLQALKPKSQGRIASMQGMLEEMLGKDDAAINQYELALNAGDSFSDNQNSHVKARLSMLFMRKALNEYENSNYAASLAYLKKAARSSPQRKDIAFNMGCVYLQLKDLHSAHRAFLIFLELSEENSPRKELTQKAVAQLKRQLASASVVRYEKGRINLDLVYEKSLSLGDLLASESDTGSLERKALLDDVLLAPYIERSIE